MTEEPESTPAPAPAPARRTAWEWLKEMEPLLHILSLLAVLYGVLYLQTHRDSFEEDQRTIEMTTSIANSWEQWFDPETRYRFYRVADLLGQMQDSDRADVAEVAEILADERSLSLYTAKKLPSNRTLVNFIQADAMMPDAKFPAKLAANRSAVIKGLNAIETLAVIIKFTKNEETKKIIRLTHGSKVLLRARQLRPFIEEYNAAMSRKSGRKYQAWGAVLEVERLLSTE